MLSTLIISLIVVLLLAHLFAHEKFVVDYNATNTQIARGNPNVHKLLVWAKPSRIQKALVLPSLNALRFRDTGQSMLQTINHTRKAIVEDCTRERVQDKREVENALVKVNNKIRMNNVVMECARQRRMRAESELAKLSKTESRLKEALIFKCRMTADNFLVQAYFNNNVLFERGNYKAWSQEKTFFIDNFKFGKTFACKCGDLESTETDDSYNHSRSAGIIIKSEFITYFSTFMYPLLPGFPDLSKHWRTYHSTHHEHDPPDQNGVKWYEDEYDDSSWELPTRSTSGFYLDADNNNPILGESNYKIWAGKNKNKYVWFRFKRR